MFDPDTIDWECPFCEPPALSFKLPLKDEPAKREQVKVIISAHLQQHRQDLLQALNERTKVRLICVYYHKGRSTEWVNLFIGQDEDWRR